MALKLTVILAMFLGLVSYSQSAPLSEGTGPSLASFKKLFNKAGYVETDESHIGRGLVIDTFELNTPTRPHYHRTVCMYVTSRGDRVIDVSHAEPITEIPDSNV